MYDRHQLLPYPSILTHPPSPVSAPRRQPLTQLNDINRQLLHHQHPHPLHQKPTAILPPPRTPQKRSHTFSLQQSYQQQMQQTSNGNSGRSGSRRRENEQLDQPMPNLLAHYHQSQQQLQQQQQQHSEQQHSHPQQQQQQQQQQPVIQSSPGPLRNFFGIISPELKRIRSIDSVAGEMKESDSERREQHDGDQNQSNSDSNANTTMQHNHDMNSNIRSLQQDVEVVVHDPHVHNNSGTFMHDAHQLECTETLANVPMSLDAALHFESLTSTTINPPDQIHMDQQQQNGLHEAIEQLQQQQHDHQQQQQHQQHILQQQQAMLQEQQQRQQQQEQQTHPNLLEFQPIQIANLLSTLPTTFTFPQTTTTPVAVASQAAQSTSRAIALAIEPPPAGAASTSSPSAAVLTPENVVAVAQSFLPNMILPDMPGSTRTKTSTPTPTPKYSCAECSKQFPSGSALAIHQLVHSGTKPYKCPAKDCTKAFRQKGHLISHYRKHTGDKPFRCPSTSCAKRFKDKSGLNTHVKRQHPGVSAASVVADRAGPDDPMDPALEKAVKEANVLLHQLTADNTNNGSRSSSTAPTPTAAASSSAAAAAASSTAPTSGSKRSKKRKSTQGDESKIAEEVAEEAEGSGVDEKEASATKKKRSKKSHPPTESTNPTVPPAPHITAADAVAALTSSPSPACPNPVASGDAGYYLLGIPPLVFTSQPPNPQHRPSPQPSSSTHPNLLLPHAPASSSNSDDKSMIDISNPNPAQPHQPQSDGARHWLAMVAQIPLLANSINVTTSQQETQQQQPQSLHPNLLSTPTSSAMPSLRPLDQAPPPPPPRPAAVAASSAPIIRFPPSSLGVPTADDMARGLNAGNMPWF